MQLAHRSHSKVGCQVSSEEDVPQVTAHVLVIDNYDSFTWNLIQYLQILKASVEVVRNDEVSAEALLERRFDRLLVSPGPKDPNRAGISLKAIALCAERIPVLGVCLGHQAIGQLWGGSVVPAKRLMHGKTSWIHHTGQGIFRGLPSPFQAARYHSLAVANLPPELEATAWSDDGELMGLRHRSFSVEGVQFHPESALSEHGLQMLRNFLENS